VLIPGCYKRALPSARKGCRVPMSGGTALGQCSVAGKSSTERRGNAPRPVGSGSVGRRRESAGCAERRWSGLGMMRRAIRRRAEPRCAGRFRSRPPSRSPGACAVLNEKPCHPELVEGPLPFSGRRRGGALPDMRHAPPPPTDARGPSTSSG
jgi:hypothetical protein